MKTYTSQQTGTLGFLREVKSLYRKNCVDNSPALAPSYRINLLLEDIRKVEGRLKDAFGMTLDGLSVLEIGPGPHKIQMIYLSQHNQVVGIDLDVLPEGWNPLAYFRVLRQNGLRRFVKTVGRKTLGIDRRYRSELMRQLGLQKAPRPVVLQMDACKISLPPESVDFVYARSVFHTLPDPAAGLDQVVRVLKPGGIAYISIHLFTSPNGSLDVRMYTNRDQEMRMWPHLRPGLRDTVRSATYLNKLRAADWYKLFEEKIPGVQYAKGKETGAQYEAEARRLQANGELGDYSLEELLTYELDAMWRKPAARAH